MGPIFYPGNFKFQPILDSHRSIRLIVMNNLHCKLSVCIPTYNGASYLAEAITSVLAQTWTDFELIIVDDCSTDATEAIVKSFADPRIKFYRNQTRLGLVGNWNRCLELASGQYSCIFHQDDVMMPENLAEKVNLLDHNPTVGMVYSEVLQIGPAEELIRAGWPVKPPPDQIGVHSGLKFFKTQLLGPNTVSCPGVVARKACYEKLGGFDPRLPFTADWEMWLRLALFYDIAYLAQPLIKYRWHDSNETLNFLGIKDLEHSYKAKMLVLEKYPEAAPGMPELKLKVIKMYKQRALDHVLHHHRRGEYDQARQYLTLALEIHRAEGPTVPTAEADWLLEIIGQLWQQQPAVAPPVLPDPSKAELPPNRQPVYRQIVDGLSGQEIAEQIPMRKLIKAIGFKIGTKPGLRWLYRYRNLGKRIVGP